MENKLTIEVTNKSVKRILNYDSEVFTEEMTQVSPGVWKSTGDGLWRQIEKSEKFVEDDILDLIDGNEFEELTQWF